MSQARAVAGVKNVVLVHGGFVDGSGWLGVYDLLRKDGYNVSIVQNPTTSLADDVAVTTRMLAAQDGPTLAEVCERFGLTEKELASLEVEIQKGSPSEQKASARRWMDANPDVIDRLAPVR